MDSEIELLDRHINNWKKEREKLDKLISEANSIKWKLINPVHKFKCPDGKDNKNAICGKCKKAFPKIWDVNDGTIGIQYPNSNPIYSKSINVNGRFCKEWQKKEITTACGCGGKHTCICGYKSEFCINEMPEECPFCGRMTEVTYYKSMGNIYTINDILKGE